MEAAKPAIPFDKLVQVRQSIKDARTIKRHAWEAEDAKLEAEQDRLDSFMLEHLNLQGAQSIATDHGTVYRSLKVKPSAADWGAIWDWIVADPARGEIMERRLKAAFVKEYMEANEGLPPPGVNVHREYEVAVRRPNNKPTPTEALEQQEQEQ